MSQSATPPRETVFVTHAAPEDNEFALWLSAKLAIRGYRVWVDRRRLRGGDDFWDEIDRVLRNDAVKQVVVFTHHIRKQGVKKELAIGDAVKSRLGDPNFMIPIRADDVGFSDAPPEFIRGNVLNAHPNWHDCLAELFATLEDAQVPCGGSASSNAADLNAIVEAREEGRRFVVPRAEAALSNWFPIMPPNRIRYFRFEGMKAQMETWLRDCRIPYIVHGRLAGTFADPAGFAEASSFDQRTPTAYDLLFTDFVSGKDPGPRDQDRRGASNDVVNLLRQHFGQVARERGLLPVEFANGEMGWFFPDGLLPEKKITFKTSEGRRIRRTMSGKFKDYRWHVCLVPKPRIWPEVLYRIHANVVLSKDGKTPLPGDKTHKRRRRLTKSWWNDIWRDRLLAAMYFLAGGGNEVLVPAGNEQFSFAAWPVEADLPMSYEATDPPLPHEEDEEGNIILRAELDEQTDDVDDEDEGTPEP